MLGHEIPSPEAARRFLKQFHSEKKIEQARQQRKPEQIAFILEEANALAGLLIDSRFRLDSDGPDEAQQFASYGGDDLALVLACRHQQSIAIGEPDLRLPGDLFDLLRHPLLPLAQRGSDAWPQPITRGRFDDDLSQMRVARFADAPLLLALAAGVLAGNHAAV